MNSHFNNSGKTERNYRTVTCKTDGTYVIIATWSVFEKALGCSFGFYAAEKCRYETTNPAEYSAEYFSVCVQRRDHNGWTTVTKTLLRLDFNCEEKIYPQRRSFKSGDMCEAVLLEQKTRKGGWIAKISGTAYEGPITNSDDVPTGTLAGTTVKLKIGAVDKEGCRIQFTWMSDRKS